MLEFPRLALLWLLASPVAATAQQDPARPGGIEDPWQALELCDAAVEAGDEATAEAAARAAEGAVASLPPLRRPDALTVRAQVLTRCRIPFAGFMQQGALVEEANRLLAAALAASPSHLDARFNLALNHYRTPAFLGRRGDALAAFEQVIARHGTLDDPRVAATYELLGELYAEVGRREDAAATWRRGAARFPDHEGLRERIGSLPPPKPGAAPPDTGRYDPPATAADPNVPAYELEPLVVEVGGYSMDDPRTASRVTKLDVYTLPGGTADVLQTFRTLPGVTQVTEGADLYVRGGDPAEAPVWVDGARLFHAGKFETLHGSLFGVLDPAALRSAYFSSGGFSARYGNALSGILDVETEARPTGRQIRVGANLASLGATARQPLGERAGAWLTGMFTHTGALLALHGRGGDYPDSPAAVQATGALVWEPRTGVRVKASALAESDRVVSLGRALGWEGPFASRAASGLGAVSLRVMNHGGTAALRVSGGLSGRRQAYRFGVLDREAEDHGLTVRLDGDLDRGRLQLRAGLEAARFAVQRDGRVPSGEELAPGSPTTELRRVVRDGNHLGGYGEFEGRLTSRLALVAGVRADALPGESGISVDPRVAAAYRLHRWTLRLGGGLFSQGRWRRRPDIPRGGTPNGIPLRARHLVAGVQSEGALAVRLEGYVKDYGDYEPDPADAGPVVVDGRARGADLLVRWAGTDLIRGWVTYSLLDATLELADGTTVSSAYDVTHTVAVVGKVALGDSWELGLTGRYATGRPYTPILGRAPSTPERPLAARYGPPHSARYPAYRRLDARLTRFVPLSDRSLVLYLEGLNVLGRHNVVGYTHDAEYRSPEPVRAFFSERTLVLGGEWGF